MDINSLIGVFDSGVGGLTVLKQLIRFLPNEKFLYLGDTARVPYGNKSQETVKRYAEEATKFLLSKNVKMIVIACNTVSSLALENVRKLAGDIPVVGMLDFSAIAAYRTSRTKNIAVIGTRATIDSQSYEQQLKQIADTKKLKIYSKPCPLFVPLVEELFLDNEATKLIASNYLVEFSEKNIDTLILGCTHYPALSKIIQDLLPNVNLIDTGEQSSIQVLRILAEKHILNNDTIDFSAVPQVEFFITDLSPNFKKIAEFLLGFSIENPNIVQLNND